MAADLLFQVFPNSGLPIYRQIVERDGVLELVRGQGMRVAPRQAPRENGSVRERQEKLMPLLRQVAAEAYQLHLSGAQVKSLIDRVLKELDGP
jgi:DNA-binding transcriptional regulator YhcF (GntR family)